MLHNVGCAFYLVEQHNAVRLAAYLLGELPRLIIADVAGRRADDARDGEFSMNSDMSSRISDLRRVEQIGPQGAYKLRLAGRRCRQTNMKLTGLA